MFISLKRILKFGCQGFARNKGLSSQVVFIMGVSVFLISSFFLARGVSAFLMEEMQQRVDLSVYFTKDATEADVLKVKAELSQFENEIQSIDYISKEKAQELFKEDHKDDSLWLEALEEAEDNPLPASLNIKSANPENYAKISSFLEASVYNSLIGNISYNQEKNKRAIDRLFDINSALKIGGTVFILFMGFLIVLITSNIIRLTIVARKGELETMKLVGASGWFIKGPFIVQSILYGVIAVTLVDLASLGALYLFDSKIKNWLLHFDLLAYFKTNFFLILLIQLCFVILLGIIATLISVRKHSKA